MTDTTAATRKQTDYILSLYNRAHGTSHTYVSQIPNTACPVSKTAQRSLTKAAASLWIDQLLRAAA